MKLVHPDLSHPLLDDHNDFTEWILESPPCFLRYLMELTAQCDGREGGFVLSENRNELDFSKNVTLITNILTLDINEKKFLNKLYAEMNLLAYSEQMFLQTQEMIQFVQNYILDMQQRLDYDLEFSDSIDLTTLWKALGIKHEVPEEMILERIIRYMNTLTSLGGTKLFIFTHLRSYLTDLQMETLLHEARFHEWKILFIENYEKACMKGSFRYMIDMDECEIY